VWIRSATCCQLIQREAAALARRARVDLDPAAEPVRAALPPGHELGLTPPEREVPGPARRRAHPERLYIADKTAGAHMSNILAKLQAANRGEAAAVAHRLGLTSEQTIGR
jgi:ATP/maltotriose-dependent transcriptional regulator MalT